MNLAPLTSLMTPILISLTLGPQADAPSGPGRVAPASREQFVQLVGGSAHNCALSNKDRVFCWGENQLGQLGRNPAETPSQSQPTEVKFPAEVSGQPIAKLVAGYDFTCSLFRAGPLYCWGFAEEIAELYNAPFQPMRIFPDQTFRDVTAHLETLCGLSGTSDYICAGAINHAEQGISQTAPFPIRSIFTGHAHVCLVTTDGDVACEGTNQFGQLGRKTTPPVSGPPAHGHAGPAAWPLQTVPGLQNASFGFAGLYGNCVVSKDPKEPAYCWGASQTLGVGARDLQPSPTDGERLPMDLAHVTQVTFGDTYACAASQGRGLDCWGKVPAGILTPESVTSVRPQLVPATAELGPITGLVTGYLHVCALGGEGKIACWGNNRDGQVGVPKKLPGRADEVYGTPQALDFSFDPARP